MRILRTSFITLCLITGAANPAFARTNIDINLSFFPDLVAIPGYPVYYAPRVDMNYFFYDGMYWLYQDDDWYVSDWYNGPWDYVDREDVPVFILRIPVRYYRRPPIYFHEWRADEPPRWGWRWGNEWERHHDGWDHWDHERAPSRAPLPVYQHGYSGDRHSDRDEHRDNRDRNYDSRPYDNDAREHEQRNHSDDHQQQHYQHQDSDRPAPWQQNRGDNNSRSEQQRNDGQRSIQPRIPYPQRMPAAQEHARENNPPRNDTPPPQHHEQEQRQNNSDNDHDRGNGQGHGNGQGWNRQ